MSDGAAISVSGGDLSTRAACVSIDLVRSRAGVLPLYGEKRRGSGRRCVARGGGGRGRGLGGEKHGMGRRTMKLGSDSVGLEEGSAKLRVKTSEV